MLLAASTHTLTRAGAHYLYLFLSSPSRSLLSPYQATKGRPTAAASLGPVVGACRSAIFRPRTRGTTTTAMGQTHARTHTTIYIYLYSLTPTLASRARARASLCVYIALLLLVARARVYMLCVSVLSLSGTGRAERHTPRQRGERESCASEHKRLLHRVHCYKPRPAAATITATRLLLLLLAPPPFSPACEERSVCDCL